MNETGTDLWLHLDDQVAAVSRVGATLRSYVVAGRPLLDGFGDYEWSRDGRGQLLLPWPNRIRGGRYQFAGRSHQLPIDEPERGNAIHGLTRWWEWRVEDRSEARVQLAIDIHPRPGFEFTLRCLCEYCLEPKGITVSVEAQNRGSGPLPFGVGFHPYVTLGTPLIDDLVVTAPTAQRLEADERGIPTGRLLPVSGTEFDLSSGRQLGATRLDTCFVAPEDGWEVRVEAPGDGHGVVVWGDRTCRYLMLYTGDSVSEPGRRRRGLAVEPMACAPDAFNNRMGLRVLEPGESATSHFGLGPL